MAQTTVTLTITGTRPILMHNARLSDPLDPIVKEMKKINAKKLNKTEEDTETLARLEFAGSLYFDDELGPYIPAENFHRCLVDAARMTKHGKKVQEGLSVESIINPLIYNGPRTLDELWADKNYVHRKSVKITTSRIIRTRPIFTNWEADFDIRFDNTVLNLEDVFAFAEKAGSYKGIGDWRPNYGRFTVKETDD